MRKGATRRSGKGEGTGQPPEPDATVAPSVAPDAPAAAAAASGVRPRSTARRAGPRLLLAASAGLVAAGGFAEVWILPRALPRPEQPFKEKKANVLAPEQLQTLLSKVAPQLPEEVRARLSAALVLEGARNGYDPLFLLALVGVESRYRMAAESGRGARGLVQLKPSTFAWISAREPDVGGEDLESGDDPVVDVRLAFRYFRWLEHRFQTRDNALMAYNAGPRNVAQALRSGELPDRWRVYPQRVRREYERLVRLSEGGPDSSGGVSEELLAREP